MTITISLLSGNCCVQTGIAEERPTTGVVNPAYAPLDEIVFQFMDLSAAKAAVIAVSHHGEVIYSRGYGWADRRRRTPTLPNTTFRLASNTKPITATVVKSLIRSGDLDADLAVFPFLGLSPFDGELGDERLNKITVKHLLDHQGGWDREETFDPMYRLKQIQQEMHLNKSPNSHRIIQYMLSQPLQFAPGERRAYSNFGYLVLGRVIEKATGQNYVDIVQSRVFEPLGTTEVHISGQGRSEVFYPNGNGFNMAARDSAGGLAASAPALCHFMHAYWINGEQRRPREIYWYYHMGSMTNTTTALMEQRLDGIDYAVMFNARRNEQYEEDAAHLRSELNRVLDSLRDQIKRRVTE
ncbi:MAG: beta-lactamase family protein [Planctomycetaceae bacterium]|nr:beta-lactamase family protein [Planctomycetaceae bacterium]